MVRAVITSARISGGPVRCALLRRGTTIRGAVTNVSSSQAQFQASAKADVDNDGSGEFGLFRELSGAVAVRTANTGAPGTAGIGVMETSSGNLAANLDVDLTETSWCCYAWPASYSTSGNRTFFVNQTGDIIGTDFATYSGTQKITAANAGAAFKTGGAATNITGLVAVGTKGRDNNIWKQIN